MLRCLLCVSDWNALWPIMQTCTSRSAKPPFSSYLQSRVNCAASLRHNGTDMGCNEVIAIQVEIGKRERMLACAEIEGLKKYHYKEMHELQDQLLAQRSLVSKLTLKVQEASQVHPYMIKNANLAA